MTNDGWSEGMWVTIFVGVVGALLIGWETIFGGLVMFGSVYILIKVYQEMDKSSEEEE